VAQDVTAERRQTEQLQWQARTDALTGLANRRAFQARLHRVEAARPVLDAQTDTLPAPVEGLADPAAAQPPLCLLLLDLDGFKAVNDSLGHLMGDQLLQEVADRLSVCVREGELLARLGGDEFGLILPGALLEQEAEARGHELLQMLRQPCQIQGHRIELRASIGLARLPEDAQDGAGLMQAADVALYSAKNAGRNRVQVFNLQLAERHARHRAVQADLAVALETGAFELFYQPLVEVNDGRVCGFEALLRWNHPSCGRILPGDFIGAAEESGLIVPLGAWVLQQACAQAARWPLDGLGGPRLSVNLSAVQLATPGLVAQVQHSLEQSGLAPERLDLEVTETALLHDLSASQTVLAQLRGLGVRVVLDDFGTGHSSLSYLRELAVDGLKIDRSFVHAAQQDSVSAEIVRSLLSLAHNLGLQVVAEGVENQAQFEQMAQLGCEQVQGFHLGPPMPAEAVANHVRRSAWLMTLVQPAGDVCPADG
jgi:diguanylate cyclase (GGDEF)-like protein